MKPKSNLLRSDAAIIIGKVLVDLETTSKVELIALAMAAWDIPRAAFHSYAINIDDYYILLFTWEMLYIDDEGTFELY